MIITAKPARAVDWDMFADITTVAVAGMRWAEGVLEVEFATDLTAEEAMAIQQRIESRNANEETLRGQALAAMQGNRDFIALPSPTNAQTLAQVKALSRQMNAAIRMVLGKLDGTN